MTVARKHKFQTSLAGITTAALDAGQARQEA
jgi:hypothetical protein